MKVAFFREEQQILLALFYLCADYAQNNILGTNKNTLGAKNVEEGEG